MSKQKYPSSELADYFFINVIKDRNHAKNPYSHTRKENFYFASEYEVHLPGPCVTLVKDGKPLNAKGKFLLGKQCP